MAGSQSNLVASLAELDLGPRSKRSAALSSEDAGKANEQLSQELAELAEALEKECFHIIFVVMPSKIRSLDALFKKNPAFSLTTQEVMAAGPVPSIAPGKAGSIALAKESKLTVVPSNAALVGNASPRMFF